MRKVIKSITLSIAIILLIFTVIFLITALFSLADNQKETTGAFFGGLFFSLLSFVLYFLIDKEKREPFSWKRIFKKIFLAVSLIFMIFFIVVLLEYLSVSGKKELIDMSISSLFTAILFFIPFILIKEEYEDEQNSFYAIFTKFSKKSKKSVDNKKASLKNNSTKIYKFEKCENCNSSEVVIKDNVYICAYCGAMLGVKV